MRRVAAVLLAASLGWAPAAAQESGTQSDAVAEAPAVLVYSRAAAFRHGSIPAATAALAEIAHGRGWTVTLTTDPAWFEADRLAQFDAVVWALPSGDTLSASQKAAFRAFIEEGGGYVGLHAAGDSSHTWPWYAEELMGARFIGHPSDPGVSPATVRVEDHDHPATRALPREWPRVDEWYSFDRSVRGKFNVLATLDETTYDAGDLAMGADHPIMWNRCLGEGRAFYSALGHTTESYAEPAHLVMIEGAIAWALGEGECPD